MLREAQCYAGTGAWGRFPQEGTHGHPGTSWQPFVGDSCPRGVLTAGGVPKPSTALGLTPLWSCGSLHFSHVSGNSTSRKILRFVDKIAKSKYFQKATENEFIKKKIEEVSNTPLLLTVEVQELAGTLAVNIPPPPTDRVWYQLSFLLRGDTRTSSLQLPLLLAAQPRSQLWGFGTQCFLPFSFPLTGTASESRPSWS